MQSEGLQWVESLTTLVLPKATDEGIIDLETHYYSVHRAFFSIVAFSLFSSVAVNYSLFDKAMFSEMTIMPFIVGCAAVSATITDSKLFHKIIGVFMFVMFIAFQLMDETKIEFEV